MIFIVALFALGPDKLPQYAKKLGEALAQFKKYSEEATSDIKESIIEPLEAAQKPLKDAVEPVAEIDKALRDNVKEVKASFASIGKNKPKPEAKEDSNSGEETSAEPEGEAAEAEAGGVTENIDGQC